MKYNIYIIFKKKYIIQHLLYLHHMYKKGELIYYKQSGYF